MSVEVKACPFCGELPYVIDDSPDAWLAGCNSCDFALGFFDTEDQARAAWNRRASPAPSPADVEAVARKLDDLMRIAELADVAEYDCLQLPERLTEAVLAGQQLLAILSLRGQTGDHIADAGKMVTDGWVLVPREPTEAMKWSGHDIAFKAVGGGSIRVSHDEAGDIYRAMIAAAPSADGGWA